MILGWTGSVQLGEPVTEEGSELTTTITLERFDVAAAGVIYDAGVQVATDSRGGSIAISTPSATPKAPPANDDWENVGPWAGFGGSNAQSTPAIVKAVELWAEAFTSGDADTLRLSVGDPSARHTYSPLIGVASTTVAVGDGALDRFASRCASPPVVSQRPCEKQIRRAANVGAAISTARAAHARPAGSFSRTSDFSLAVDFVVDFHAFPSCQFEMRAHFGATTLVNNEPDRCYMRLRSDGATRATLPNLACVAFYRVVSCCFLLMFLPLFFLIQLARRSGLPVVLVARSDRKR